MHYLTLLGDIEKNHTLPGDSLEVRVYYKSVKNFGIYGYAPHVQVPTLFQEFFNSCADRIFSAIYGPTFYKP